MGKNIPDWITDSEGWPVPVWYRFEPTEKTIGEKLPPSRRWIDGEPTDEILPGTSALLAGAVEQYAPAYSSVLPYCYQVTGQSAGYGEDPGEEMVKNCIIVAPFDFKK